DARRFVFLFQRAPPKQPAPIDWIQTCGSEGNIVKVCDSAHSLSSRSRRKAMIYRRRERRILLKLATAIIITALLAAGIGAQQPTAWTGWSQKDAEKILNDSPWGQTQTDTNTSEMV